MGVANKVAILVLLMGFVSIIPAQMYCQNSNKAEVSLMLSIPPLSLIDFVTPEDQMITYGFSMLEPNHVEQVITPSTSDNTWLNYSSIVTAGATNYITVYLSSGSLPADVKLRVLISEDAGLGEGSAGKTLGEITLSSYPQNIIINIGSCYTGNGINKGHRITYIWDNPEGFNYSNKYKNGEAIAVTYTITSTE